MSPEARARCVDTQIRVILVLHKIMIYQASCVRRVRDSIKLVIRFFFFFITIFLTRAHVCKLAVLRSSSALQRGCVSSGR